MQKQKVLEKTGLSDKGSVIFFGVVCWVTYFSIYLGRLNFSASMSEGKFYVHIVSFYHM